MRPTSLENMAKTQMIILINHNTWVERCACTRAKCARGHEHEKRKLGFRLRASDKRNTNDPRNIPAKLTGLNKRRRATAHFFPLDNRTTRKQEIGKVRFGQLILCNRPHSPPVYRRNKLTRHVRRTRGQACKSRVEGDE